MWDQDRRLLLIHGIGGDADEWAFCFEALGKSHRVIALDLLGFGRSDKPLIEYTIAGFVEVHRRFLHSSKIERPPFWASRWVAGSRQRLR